MGNSYFSFKKFTVFQDRCAMKVGVDGVLLGAWASVENTKNILDVGTGTGLIALMLAQRSTAAITAIDIDKNAVEQAIENVIQSPWQDRIDIINQSFQNFTDTFTAKFDLIVSNPPYFVNALKAPDFARSSARHTDFLSHEDLIDNASELLNPNGRICLILPPIEAEKCKQYALKKELFCNNETFVYPKPDTKPKRVLLEFSNSQTLKSIHYLTMEENERHIYTNEFKTLVKDFYLKL
jgi:tRNA1Val (adenine37-N6)-methyltransferase